MKKRNPKLKLVSPPPFDKPPPEPAPTRNCYYCGSAFTPAFDGQQDCSPVCYETRMSEPRPAA